MSTDTLSEAGMAAFHAELSRHIYRCDEAYRSAIRAYLAATQAAPVAAVEAPAPSEEPVASKATAKICQACYGTGRGKGTSVACSTCFGTGAVAVASPAVAPVAVSVKALQWKEGAKPDYAGNKFWRSLNAADWSYRIYLEDGRYILRNRGADFDTLEAAKAAAQADFNARILSSIIPATKGGEVVEAMVEAAMSVPPIPNRGPNVFNENRMRSALFAALAQDTDGVAKP